MSGLVTGVFVTGGGITKKFLVATAAVLLPEVFNFFGSGFVEDSDGALLSTESGELTAGRTYFWFPRQAAPCAAAAQGAAAPPGPTGTAAAHGAGPSGNAAVGGDTDSARQREKTREENRVQAEAQLLSRKSRSFSSVNTDEANGILLSLRIFEVNGNKLKAAEVVLPPGTPECRGFTIGAGVHENQATPDLLKHHQEQLELLGINFEKEGGFEMFDVHHASSDGLRVIIRNTTYRGIFDGCVAPFGLLPASALRQCRIIYEHKKSKKDAPKGQLVLNLLAACAHGPCPVVLDVTDGQTHDVYTIRGNKLIVWKELTPTQAYYLQAQHLKASDTRAVIDLELEQISEEEQATMRPLHTLQPVSPLQEQLDSLIPFLPPEEHVPAMLELIGSWMQGQEEEE